MYIITDILTILSTVGLFIGAVGKRIKTNTVYTVSLRAAAILIAICGACVFIKNSL